MKVNKETADCQLCYALSVGSTVRDISYVIE